MRISHAAILWGCLMFPFLGASQTFDLLQNEVQLGPNSTNKPVREVVSDIDEETGQIVTVWRERVATGDWDIYLNVTDKNFNPVAGTWPHLVNTINTTGEQYHPVVKIDQSTHEFAVAWVDLDPDLVQFPGLTDRQVFLQRFNADGTTLGTNLLISNLTTRVQEVELSFNDVGELLVAYHDIDASDRSIYGSVLDFSAGSFSVDGSSNPLQDILIASGSGPTRKNELGDVEWHDPANAWVIGYHSYRADAQMATTGLVKLQFRDSDLANQTPGGTEHTLDNGSPTGQYDIHLDVNRNFGTILLTWTRLSGSATTVHAKSLKVDVSSGISLSNDLATFAVHTPGANEIQELGDCFWSETTDQFMISFLETDLAAFSAMSYQGYVWNYCYEATGLSNTSSFPITNPLQSLPYAVTGFREYDLAYSKDHQQIVLSYLDYDGATKPQNGEFVKANSWKLNFPGESFAWMHKKQDANLYPVIGHLCRIAYESRYVPEALSFRFYDDFAKTWDPIPAITKNTIVGPNKIILDVTNLPNDKTYLISIENAKGKTEYLRILKKPGTNCSNCVGCQ